MKLSIHGNSVRLRLSRTDVQLFGRNGHIHDEVQFAPGSRLLYALESTTLVEEVEARYDDGTILVLVPVKVAQEWIGSDRVGISFAGPVGLSLLIEKDFRCLHREPSGELDDVDAFPNPLTRSDRESITESSIIGKGTDRNR
jgi:hypothetical protein